MIIYALLAVAVILAIILTFAVRSLIAAQAAHIMELQQRQRLANEALAGVLTGRVIDARRRFGTR